MACQAAGSDCRKDAAGSKKRGENERGGGPGEQRRGEGRGEDLGKHFERTARRCYNLKVPLRPSASAVLLRGIPPSESARCTARLAAIRFGDSAVQRKGQKWPGSSGGRAQP